MLSHDDRHRQSLVMSTRARAVLTDEQVNTIKKFAEPLPIDVTTIENIGGGGIRCMIAEIFHPMSNPRAAVYVSNEILPLRRVIVHRPDNGLEVC